MVFQVSSNKNRNNKPPNFWASFVNSFRKELWTVSVKPTNENILSYASFQRDLCSSAHTDSYLEKVLHSYILQNFMHVTKHHTTVHLVLVNNHNLETKVHYLFSHSSTTACILIFTNTIHVVLKITGKYDKQKSL